MSTKTKTLQRNYDKLTDLERFRAIMAAWERGDEGEIRALGSTAPKATYKMTAWPYRGMLDAIGKVAWLTLTQILSDGLLMIMAWGLDFGDRAIEHYGGEEADIKDIKGCEPTDWEKAVARAQAVLSSWDGLALFCEEIGITVEQAMAHAPASPSLTVALNFAREILDLDDTLFLRKKVGYQFEGYSQFNGLAFATSVPRHRPWPQHRDARP